MIKILDEKKLDRKYLDWFFLYLQKKKQFWIFMDFCFKKNSEKHMDKNSGFGVFLQIFHGYFFINRARPCFSLSHIPFYWIDFRFYVGVRSLEKESKELGSVFHRHRVWIVCTCGVCTHTRQLNKCCVCVPYLAPWIKRKAETNKITSLEGIHHCDTGQGRNVIKNKKQPNLAGIDKKSDAYKQVCITWHGSPWYSEI